MIIREEKRIVNGRGTISVGAIYRTLEVNHIQPPQEVGGTVKIKDVEVIDGVAFARVATKEIRLVLNELKQIDKACSVEFFDGWTLDFTNYNKKSVDVFIKSLNTMLIYSQLALAC